MTYFNSNNNESRGNKIKNIKLIHQLRNDTYDNKLKWKILYKDNDVTTYSTSHDITKNKKITFSLRCEEGSKIKDCNILRVILQTTNLKPPMSSFTSTIKTISLNDYPSLIQLIKLLKDKHIEKKSKTISVVAKNLDEYKFQILDSIRDMINNLRNTGDKKVREMKLYYILDEIHDSKTIEEVNELLFKAYMTSNESEN